MPGYLSNRYITFNPAAAILAVQTNVSSIDARLTEAEASIDDLSLNIGV
jgi:hypothetical protein